MPVRRIISQISGDEQLRRFVEIQRNAYPGSRASVETILERWQHMIQQDSQSTIWAVWEEGEMTGGMRLIDYSLNYCGRFIPAGGVGAVAVDLVHKKKGTAKDMITFFLNRCEKQGQYLAMLYPFRPDFYHKMGFGYGPVMYQFRAAPSSFPRARERYPLQYLTEDDLELIADCYQAYAEHQHGFCKRERHEFENLVKNFAPHRRLLGYKKDGRLLGYLAFTFQRAHDNNFVKNDMYIREWIWLNQEALAACCSFLHTQADQINRVIVNTQIPDFFYLLSDVRNGSDNIIPSVYHETSTAGVGLMYRIVNVEKFLKQTSYRNYCNATAAVRLEVSDSFRPSNQRSYTLEFVSGRLTLNEAAQPAVSMSIDIADLSSLLMGSTNFRSLYRLGRVYVSDDSAVPLLTSLFEHPTKPECITAF